MVNQSPPALRKFVGAVWESHGDYRTARKAQRPPLCDAGRNIWSKVCPRETGGVVKKRQLN